MPGDFTQALKGFFNGKDDKVCVFGNPRCDRLLGSEEKLVIAAPLPDAACLFEFPQHAAILHDGDRCAGRREVFNVVLFDGELDARSGNWTGGDNARRACEHNRKDQDIWRTPAIKALLSQEQLVARLRKR